MHAKRRQGPNLLLPRPITLQDISLESREKETKGWPFKLDLGKCISSRFLLEYSFVANSCAFSLKKLPRLKHIDHVDISVLVLRLDVLSYVGFHLALVLAIRTLESWLLTALISQMAGQVPLPREHASTIGIRTGVLARFH